MNGVKFNELHSYNDLGFYLKSYTIGEAPLVEQRVSVPAMNGTLDYADFFGFPVFGDRQLKISLKIIGTYEKQAEKYANLQNLIHGRKMNIIFDDDDGWAYDGRIKVGELTHHTNGGAGYVDIIATCYPYKKRLEDTLIEAPLTTNFVRIEIKNDSQEVVPEFVSTVKTTILWNNETYSFGSGSAFFPQIVLPAGDSVLQAKAESGTGNLQIKFRGGSL